jgi:hypothetical protein
VNVFHDEEEALLALDDIDHGHDVWMTDARDDARLIHEHRDELGVLEVVRMQPLDRDRASEPDGAEQSPEMDRRHPARGELIEQRVPTNDERRGHCCCGCGG